MKKHFLSFIVENPSSKISAKKNIDYSRFEVEQQGFVVEAYDENEKTISCVYASLDDLFNDLLNVANFRGSFEVTTYK